MCDPVTGMTMYQLSRWIEYAEIMGVRSFKPRSTTQANSTAAVPSSHRSYDASSTNSFRSFLANQKKTSKATS